ncbi:DDE-type integrase/transposase/recombinase [Bacillus thuringiensis]|uniref:DDE-type integrase/transposase/recombinase n=1 Tax=Bacillus thuringiensis TaxID=1428 RepID=UPI003BF6BB56
MSYLDKIYIKVKEEWRYLYRAIDMEGHTLGIHLCKKAKSSRCLYIYEKVSDSFWRTNNFHNR